MSNGKKVCDMKSLLFPKLDGKVSIGAYNLIQLKTETFIIYFNSNGIYNEQGEKVSSNSVIKKMQDAQLERAKAK